MYPRGSSVQQQDERNSSYSSLSSSISAGGNPLLGRGKVII
jgi:hypothetical protein